VTKISWKRDARTLAIGAGWGFLAGAVFVCVLVWRYGGEQGRPSATTLSVRDIVEPGMAAIDAPHVPRATSTTGMSPVPGPTAANPVLEPAPGDVHELADRHLEIPVDGVRPEQLVRSFDERRGGGSRPHEALDIVAPRNTPVKAVEGGTIARLFFSQAGGITVYQFDPSGRYCYYYAHLERYADGLREGALLQKGQVIGYVGTSGNAPKGTPHLHFAIFRLTTNSHWWEGTPMDPYDILR
jgi:murein DD-endopeptidase MepM/ murein hydrolase activator NlpD